MAESADTRLKRLGMRSWRRGTKEMDIILGRFSDERLATLDADALDHYEALLSENDQDLYQWVSGQSAPPERFADLVATIADHTATRAK
ncbi:succinate dehydrogenase assembly factor 2 [Maritimibacter dapengensis]|uniref:Succinate dehydrogenase assembly factor 2 n=1 Tax=Maritimibacter dapengensis TaxID=2836868 RepID=A0ABS6SZ18_9RHOB|nr:succinate dehydrogenase assembly factor 2 [Maritimibacter dapengensis]MBV7378217.1 succinate dehydrogenase assembly factor 2 [Maritimibacter dapengensis]